MVSADAVSIVRELAIRESGQSGSLALLGPRNHAAPYTPVARKLGITKRIGWHTFRHTYSTLLRSTGAELKIMQKLLRHSTIRVTLDTSTQAVTTEKRNTQGAVVALLFREKTQET
jgi:integrase